MIGFDAVAHRFFRISNLVRFLLGASGVLGLDALAPRSLEIRSKFVRYCWGVRGCLTSPTPRTLTVRVRRICASLVPYSWGRALSLSLRKGSRPLSFGFPLPLFPCFSSFLFSFLALVCVVCDSIDCEGPDGHMSYGI